MTGNKIIIEIISDVICPWCWVGKRKLETALKTYHGGSTKIDPQIIWRPYQLRPNTPLEGIPKSPDTPENPRVGSRLKNAGASVGIDFTGKTDRTPNTLLSHALLEFVLEKYGWEKQNQLQEAIFKSYFTDGVFLDKESLVSISSKFLDAREAEVALTDEHLLKKVRDEVNQNYDKVYGQGVPFFIFNGRPAFSGAQDPATFHQVIDQLLNE